MSTPSKPPRPLLPFLPPRTIPECLIDLLSRIDLDTLSFELRNKANTETSKQRKTEALKRLQVVESLRESNLKRENNPEWMIMKAIRNHRFIKFRIHGLIIPIISHG